MVDRQFWRRRRILLTGHTGFKGAWLSLWLSLLEAEVIGYSLPPPTVPSLFDLARLNEVMTSIGGNVRDLQHLSQTISDYRPEIIIHLAAQALVRRSYVDPLETYATNIMGTVNLLEAVRQNPGVKAVIVVTSDKCYENREWCWGYREIDPVGGSDPYSSSKGCAELITAAYRNSFFSANSYSRHGAALASVRAGNVIGGGDWAEDRLIPDLVKAFAKGEKAKIRYPNAQRPWQHVLEPLQGYIVLAEKLYHHGPEYGEAWNFGPPDNAIYPVAQLVEHLCQFWGPEAQWEIDQGVHAHEANFLKLDSSKARQRLGWKPKLPLEQALEWTAAWYRANLTDPLTTRELSESQIKRYQDLP
ncbi:CDP-glucose 4,6-dehydratase [Desulfobacca acetoxidans]